MTVDSPGVGLLIQIGSADPSVSGSGTVTVTCEGSDPEIIRGDCDNDGVFNFPPLRAGTYKLQVWYRGKWIHSQAVTVRSGKTNLDIKLPALKD